MALKAKRFEIRTEDDFLTQLEALAVASGVSKSEVIHRAIGLYSRALQEAEEGKVIQFVSETPMATKFKTANRTDGRPVATPNSSRPSRN
jgi:hypothetical protein